MYHVAPRKQLAAEKLLYPGETAPKSTAEIMYREKDGKTNGASAARRIVHFLRLLAHLRKILLEKNEYRCFAMLLVESGNVAFDESPTQNTRDHEGAADAF